MDEFKKIAHHAVLESTIGAKTVAQKIGKPYSTLLRELNPHDDGAKLGAETLMHIMAVINDIAPLKSMAKTFGYELVPIKRNTP